MYTPRQDPARLVAALLVREAALEEAARARARAEAEVERAQGEAEADRARGRAERRAAWRNSDITARVFAIHMGWLAGGGAVASIWAGPLSWDHSGGLWGAFRTLTIVGAVTGLLFCLLGRVGGLTRDDLQGASYVGGVAGSVAIFVINGVISSQGVKSNGDFPVVVWFMVPMALIVSALVAMAWRMAHR